MMITNLFFHQMSMQFLIMADGMFLLSPLQKVFIIKLIIHPAQIFQGIKISLYLLPTWPVSSKYNFIGGYEHDTQGGLLHIADHHISPGKKQWTWGNGEFGKAWDRNLTDEDGPYIELMTGVYTDNQPDFSWIQPYEEKTFVQYFMPYREVGVIKNATKEAVINFDVHERAASIKLYVTCIYDEIKSCSLLRMKNFI